MTPGFIADGIALQPNAKSTNSEVLSSSNLSRVFVVAQAGVA